MLEFKELRGDVIYNMSFSFFPLSLSHVGALGLKEDVDKLNSEEQVWG